MKKKKVLSLLVVLAGIFTLVACDDTGESAFDLLMRVEDQTADVDSMIMEMEMNMTMRMFGQSIESTSTSRTYTVNLSPNEVLMRSETLTETMGMEMPSTMYFRNGMMYMDMMGEQMKFEMPLEEAMQMANVDGFEFDEDAIISQSISTNGNNRELNFVLDFGSVMDSLSGELGTMMEMFGGIDMEGMFDGVSVDLTVVIDADYQMTSMTMAYEIDIEGTAMSIEMTWTIVQLGGVEITFPDNLDEFEEMDSMMLGF